MTESAQGSADPTEMLDKAPMSRVQKRAVAIVALISMVDGYDVLSVTFAAPGIAQDWALRPAALGTALASGLAGMALGSLLLAPAADIIGRRRMVIINLILMSAGLLLSSFASSVTELLIWRAITGIGIGAMVPIITPLAVEFSNAKTRGLALALMAIGYPLGGTAGGLIAAILLYWFEWPAVFQLGAAASFLLLLVVIRWLPEPLTYLLARRDEQSLSRVNRFLTLCDIAEIEALPPVKPKTTLPYREIFIRPQLWATLRMTAINLLFVMSVYYILSWIPKLVADAGNSATIATIAATCCSLSGAITGLMMGLSAGRAFKPAFVAFLMIGLGVIIPLFPSAAAMLPLLGIFAVSTLLGVFLYGAAVGIYGLIVNTFLPHYRATGAGFVLGIGRASAALAPALAGGLMEADLGPTGVSAILAAPTIAAGMIILLTSAGRPVSV